MIGRIIWFAALAGIAVLTIVLQLDLHARTVPETAALVPAPLRNFAQTRITQQALLGKDPALALAEAQRLVRRRPIPAEYLTLLAAGQARAGQNAAAAMTIQVAGQRGWREPLAQEAVLRLALAAGDKPEAARRFAALFLRDRTPDALLRQLAPAVLDEAGGLGQQTFVAIVVGGERWHRLFLRRGVQVMPPAAFSAIAAESLRRGAAFECGGLAQSLKGLTRSDPAAAAQLRAAAAARCPELAA